MIPDLGNLDARSALLRVEEAMFTEMAAQADTLALAAHWCDLHGGVEYDAESRVVLPGDEKLIRLGGDGTPEVEEFAAAEFGAMRHQHPIAARNLMADALDLRHRLPRCWRAVHELKLDVWVARKIAVMTRKLDRAAAGLVDDRVAPEVGTLPPGRLLSLVEAAIIEADPELAEREREAKRLSTYVRTQRDGSGLMVLIARAHAGDVIVLDAMIDRIAELLAEQGSEEPADARRARAIGILADPAEALRMLLAGAEAAGVPPEEAESELTRDGLPPEEPEQRKEPEDELFGDQLLGDGSPAQDQPATAGRPDATEERTGSAAPPSRPTLRDLLETNAGLTRPAARLFIHCAGGAVARVEGFGPITTAEAREWLGHCHVTVTQVLDLAGQRPVDGYEIPARMREAAHQVAPAEPFPWSVNTGRRRDADHVKRYVPPARGGPPGQTALDNIALLLRHHHRLKTFGRWESQCTAPGRYAWRSPNGFLFSVTERGTRRLGELYYADLTLAA